MSGFSIYPVESAQHIAEARRLFVEYAGALGFSLCFQNFDKELETLPGAYAPPAGRLLLAEDGGEVAGCVALRSLDSDTAEMKRLYVAAKFRGKGLGRALAERVIQEARSIGYGRMRLDTVEPVMKNAVSLYRELSFREIQPYTKNPIAGALYMELIL
jgi:putative acetyltransferase